MYKVLSIKNGATEIAKITNNIDFNINELLLIEEDGFDNFSNFTVETEPKLIGAGSYIVAERIGERIITIQFNTLGNSRTLYNTFENLALTFTNLTLTMSYFNDISTTAFETKTLTGKITSIRVPEGGKNWADIELTFVCPNPIKI